MFSKKGFVFAATLLATAPIYAQTAGSTIVGAGWLHLAPQSSSDPLYVKSSGGRVVNQSIPGTGSGVSAADTLGLTVNHFFTDNVSVELVAGLPPAHKINGTGTYDKYGELGSVKQWSPALLMKYYFGQATTKFRPYVGLGINYTWFSDAKITNAQFSQAELHAATPSMTSVKADASWNPVFNIGASYAITDRWYAMASVSYLPLKTTAHLTTTMVNGAKLESEANLRVRPIVSLLSVGYRF